MQTKYNKLFEAQLHESVESEFKACVNALMLLSKKAEDYNTGVERKDYFPFGLTSYSHMIHTKSLRLVSLCKSDKDPNFESARDTLLDLINYAAMTLVEMDTDNEEHIIENIINENRGK